MESNNSVDDTCEHMLYPLYITAKDYLNLFPDDKLSKKEILGNRVKVRKCHKCGYFTERVKQKRSPQRSDHFRKQKIRRGFR